MSATAEALTDDPTVTGGSWSTLASGYTSGATTLVITSNTVYGKADPTLTPPAVIRVRIDNELFLVTDNRTTTWTVTGAQEGSSAANHASTATVTQVITKESLKAIQTPYPRLNVKDYGAKGDTVTLTDVSVTNGSAVVTSASAAFTSADAGKTAVIYSANNGSPNNTLVTTILSVQSATQVTLATNALATHTLRTMHYGTDDTAAITAAKAAMVTGLSLYFPKGRYIDTAARSFDDTVHQGCVGDTKMSSWGASPGTAESEWLVVYASSSDWMTAHGSNGFELRSLTIKVATQDFTGVIYNPAGKTGAQTVSPTCVQVTIGTANGVGQSTAALDLRGTVSPTFERCTFDQPAVTIIKTSSGPQTYANAVTFNKCVFVPISGILDTLSAVTLYQWAFWGCIFENYSGVGPAGGAIIAPQTFQGLAFHGCGFWDNSERYINVPGTSAGLTISGCFANMPSGEGFMKVGGTLDGLVVVGSTFYQAASAATSFFESVVGTIKNFVFQGNSLGSSVTDNTQTIGNVFFAAPQPGAGAFIGGISSKAGWYSCPLGVNGSQAAGTNNIWASPIQAPVRLTLTRIGANVATAAASSTVRLGIYADDGTGHPGKLVLDAGTIDSTTTGFKEITISQTLEPGLYWLSACNQGGNPTLNANVSDSHTGMTSTTAADLLSNNTIIGYGGPTAAGALPSSWGATINPRYNGPRILVKC